MLNTAFIQSNLPNLQTQEQLLKDRFEEEKANGYNFEFLPLPELRQYKEGRLKFANRFDLESREYPVEELNEICFALTNGLVEGIIKEANTRDVKTGKYTYTLESLVVPFGEDIYNSSGYILYVTPSVDYYTTEKEIKPPYLLSILNVIFDK